jgi:hypothetical protein
MKSIIVVHKFIIFQTGNNHGFQLFCLFTRGIHASSQFHLSSQDSTMKPGGFVLYIPYKD